MLADKMPVVRVAAVQAASVGIDRKATTDKVCNLIQEAAKNGAKLVVFPEAFIPVYPYWIWLGSPTWWMPFYKELFLNSVEIPSETTKQLCETAKRTRTYIAVGINERKGKTLYNTLLFICPDGEIMGSHRKLEATFAEKMIWARGDGSTLYVFDTEIGFLGGLICSEHMNDLARYSLYAMNEYIHVAAWPGMSAVRHNPRSSVFNTLAESAAIYHAVAGGTFVINTFSLVGEDLIEKMGLQNRPDMIVPGGGRTAIYAPNATMIGGPVEDKEVVVYADLDPAAAIAMNLVYDPTGCYARPEVLSLRINRQPLSVIEEADRIEIEDAIDEGPDLKKQNKLLQKPYLNKGDPISGSK